MTELALQILILLSLLQIKHMFSDYFLQTSRMLEGRGTYFHMGRAQHALVHAVGSLICLLIVGAPIGVILVLILLEWVVHFHIDWAKAAYTATKGHGPADAGFWRAAGFDQFLHQMTYVAMIWAWLVFAAR
ncbi:DUF3307 domain-containing protein [Aestuariivita boseongensis]|uniref:DUF3307 domain-containing protein n=1 Tax=Aestuariivita boseongensis TaxID=1470562 RepID=UPI0009E2654B|nr:DUF3307 domain-containing protein [Aestuariivita boseongensis]